MSSYKLALALRPQVFHPRSIVRLAGMLDEKENLSHIFIPDISGSFESLETSSAALGNTKRLRIGSGVIRLLEHDQRLLFRRLETLQAISSNRFVLGVGTGNPGPKPRETIHQMIELLGKIGSAFDEDVPRSLGLKMPETFVATLRYRITKAVAGHSNGILMNFCSPAHATKLIHTFKEKTATEGIFACYLKVFYSKDKAVANRLLVEEFSKYDQFPQYHEMFMEDSVADSIIEARESLSHGTKFAIPKKLLEISLSNATSEELKKYVEKFRIAGVTLPCVYPYFPIGEEEEFKLRKVVEIVSEL